MKNKLYIIASIFAVLCLICSCGGGSGSDASGDDGPVKVSFGVDTADGSLRTASVTNPDVTTNLTYEYKATPKWTSSEFGTLKGYTNDQFVTFNPVGTTNASSIYFAQGQWDIEVQVKKGDVIIYKTKNYGSTTDVKNYKTTYINKTSASTPIEIEVEKYYDSSLTGKITIKDLYAPDTSGADKLVVEYGKLDGTGSTTTVEFLASEKAAAGTGTWVNYNKYNAEIDSVPAGAYWVTVGYYNGTNLVGASSVNADIIAADLGAEITGSIQNGVWASSNIKVAGVNKIEAEVTVTGFTTLTEVISMSKTGAGSLPKTLTINCTATITDVITNAVVSGTKNYTLCVNADKDSNTSGAFTFNAATYDPGTYSIYIIAADSTNKISTTATPVLNVTIND